MSDIPHFTLDVDDEANVHLEAHNFKGGECLKATQSMEKALGRVVTRTKKKEFFERAVSTVKKLRIGR